MIRRGQIVYAFFLRFRLSSRSGAKTSFIFNKMKEDAVNVEADYAIMDN